MYTFNTTIAERYQEQQTVVTSGGAVLAIGPEALLRLQSSNETSVWPMSPA